MIISSIILVIACIKWRFLADFIIYISTIMLINSYAIPSTKTSISEIYISVIWMFGNVIFMTDQVGQLIYISFMHLLFTFALKSTVFDEKMNLHLILIKLFMVAGTFAINALLSMILLYISSLHSRMKSSNVENTKLLDAMHEGLLILSKADNESMFCNFPAQKLLKNAVEYFEKK